MDKIAVVGCGAYMDSGYGCPGEWRCLKAAALGEGNFDKQVQVVGFLRCECPGRTVAANAGMFIKMSELKPDRIYLSTCMAKAKPANNPNDDRRYDKCDQKTPYNIHNRNLLMS